MTKKGELRCEVRRGMFESERIVRFAIIGANGKEETTESIVHRDSIVAETSSKSENAVVGTVKVFVADRRDGRAAVILPQATIDNGPYVVVPEVELV